MEAGMSASEKRALADFKSQLAKVSYQEQCFSVSFVILIAKNWNIQGFIGSLFIIFTIYQ